MEEKVPSHWLLCTLGSETRTKGPQGICGAIVPLHILAKQVRTAEDSALGHPEGGLLPPMGCEARACGLVQVRVM